MHVNSISLAALLAAIVPTAVFLWVASAFGRSSIERKPRSLLATVFLWGAVPSMWVAMAANRFFNRVMMYDPEVGLTTPEQASAAIIILGLLTPMLEESVKALPLLFVFLLLRRHFAGVMDGMLYGALVGLGFGMTENYQYIYRAGLNSGVPVAAAVMVTRSIIFGLTHTVWSTPFGIGLGIARNTHSKVIAVFAPCCGLVVGVLFHGLHNSSFLWATLQRGYGVPAVVLSLAIYGFSYITWLVLAFKARRCRVESIPSSEECGSPKISE